MINKCKLDEEQIINLKKYKNILSNGLAIAIGSAVAFSIIIPLKKNLDNKHYPDYYELLDEKYLGDGNKAYLYSKYNIIGERIGYVTTFSSSNPPKSTDLIKYVYEGVVSLNDMELIDNNQKVKIK